MAADRPADRCRRNLHAVLDRIAAACGRAGRDPAEVRLVGATKSVPAELARLLAEAGCPDLAESRPQSLWAKATALAGLEPPPRWHLIGHLQRNKIRRTLPLLTLLHSLDSHRLLEALETEGAVAGIICEALVEVNISREPGRTGVGEADVEALLEAAGRAPHVRVVGLMGMASLPEAGAARAEFARLRELRDRLEGHGAAPGGLRELSMGMSGDFEEAILEGATIVRIGSALWEGMGDASTSAGVSPPG
jgi:pyridoxal phosphate enzyme (YggS family)